MSQAIVAAEALLATKLSPPPARAELVPRRGLSARLEAGQRLPLTLVVASAGSGKTTLLGARHAARPEADAPALAWLTLDAGDNDLPRFLRYLVAALRAAGVEVGTGVMGLLQAPQLPTPSALVTPLVNDLAAVPREVILTLDDYHTIELPAIHQALAFFIEHLPARVHLTLSSRTDPPLPLGRLRVRGQLAELRAADLRFTTEEAADFLTRVMGLRLRAADIAALGTRTEGWIAGLQLAALSLQGQADASDFIAAFAGSHRYLVDYLAEEVLQRQPRQLQDFLLRSSILDRLSAPLCEAVADVADGQVLLEWLDRENLFLVALDEERHWYRYHHLFADFLRERLRRMLPGEVRTLHLRACQWYERQGLREEAIGHALAAGDYETAARLVEETAERHLWRLSEPTTVLRWLERLPAEVVRARPKLCIWYAWALQLLGQLGEIEEHLRAAEAALAGAERDGRVDEAGQALRGDIATIRAVLARYHGDAAETIRMADEALARLPEDHRMVRSIAIGLRGVAYRLTGDVAAASQALREAARVSEASDNMVTALIALGRLAEIQGLRGGLGEAADTYREAVECAARRQIQASPALSAALVAMGRMLCERNELDAAERLLRDGLERGLQWLGVLAEFAVDAAIGLARVSLARGDPRAAHALLERATEIGRATGSAVYADRAALALARWRMARGEFAAMAEWLAARHAERRGAGGAPSAEDLEAALLMARLRCAQGTPSAALALLGEARATAEARDYGRMVLEALCLQALALRSLGQSGPAMDALARALALAEPEGFVRIFVDEGLPMGALLGEARDRGGYAPAFVARLLAAFGEPAAAANPITTPITAPLAAPPPLVEPLSERELEVLRLIADGLSTAAIAERLVITPGTVKNHLKHVFAKLDAHTRLQAVERARALRLL